MHARLIAAVVLGLAFQPYAVMAGQPAMQLAQACSPGFYFVKGVCIRPPCPRNMHRDSSGACIANPPPPCPTGTIRLTPTGFCMPKGCPIGEFKHLNGSCSKTPPQ